MKKEIGVQIINHTNYINILVVECRPNRFDSDLTSTYRTSWYDFLNDNSEWNYSMNRATKAYHNNLESAVEHIMAGRTSYGEYPQLVSNDVKIDAIMKCQKVFAKIKNMEKYSGVIAEKQAQIDKLKKEMEEFKKSVGI